MSNKELQEKIAKLESINDQLASEIRYLHQIAKKLGFPEGLKTLKEAALELIQIEDPWEDFFSSKDEESPPPTE